MPTALITGAASGIGRATARLFAQHGWRCVLLDRQAEGLQRVAAELPAAPDGTHLLRVLDLTDADQIDQVASGLPPLDALINNAGMSDRSNLPIVGQSLDELQPLLALNLRAPAALVRACLPRLTAQARVVNVASGAGLHAIPWRGAYSPSKAGLLAQTQALARACARTHPGLCVTALAPGFVRTELVDTLIAAGRLHPERAVAKIPLGRMAAPDELAQALFFLASAGAAPLHGQWLAVDGGSSVFGGSQPFAASAFVPLPMAAALALEVQGSPAPEWQAWASGLAVGAGAYPARLDLSAWQQPPQRLLAAVHAAAAQFVADHPQQASLTLMLPPAPAADDWQAVGEHAAVCMAVATLACEWGAQALRINALVCPPHTPPAALYGLLHYLAGARAQYLTGQVLTLGVATHG